jgi:hypothetical protein
MRRTAIGIGCVGIFLASGVAHAQIPEGYEMVRLTGFGLYSRPDINNRGEVIWSYSEPPSVSDVYKFSGGIIRKLTDDTYYDIQPRINDHGDYAYLIAPDYFGDVDVAWNIGGQLTIHDANNAPNAHPDINNAGQIVWEDRFTEDASDERVFLFDGVTVQQITFNGVCNHSPRVNDCGEVVIDASDTTQSGNPSTILLFENGILGALTDGELRRSGPINNNSGQIVWHESNLNGLNDRIMLWEQGVAMPLVEQDGVGGSSINSNGDITYDAWNANLQAYDLWLYRSSDQSFLLLPNAGFSHDGWVGMNECGELAWRTSVPGGGPLTVLLMRRIAPMGDFNHDCRIDAYDFQILENCFTGSGAGPEGGLLADCTRGDFDQDNDVDEADVSAFLAAVGGPAVLVPDCQAVELCGS